MLAEISANTEEAVAKQEVAQTKEEDLAIMTEKITVQKSEAEAVIPKFFSLFFSQYRL